MFVYVLACVCGLQVVFSACAHSNAEVSGRREGLTCQVFVAAWYERDVFHMYIMTINYSHIWKVLALVYHLCGKIVPFSLARPP